MDLPIGDPDPQALTYLLEQMPGGVHIQPHVEDGPWWIVAVTNWDEPNWQLQACLSTYPGTEAPADLPGEGPLSFHIVPDFVRRMCEWHTAEYEAEVETNDFGYAAGPFDTRPSAGDLQRHIDAVVAGDL